MRCNHSLFCGSALYSGDAVTHPRRATVSPAFVLTVTKGVKMKKVLLAGAAMITLAGTANAVDLGWGLSLNNKVESTYNITDEHTDVTWTPSVGYTMYSVSLSAGMDVPVYNTTDEFALLDTWEEGSRPDLDLAASYELGAGLVGKVEADFDLNETEIDDLTVGVTFSF